jgi:hypothetical protein
LHPRRPYNQLRIRASQSMNETAKNAKNAKECTSDFCLPWRTWRLGGSIC